MNYQSVSRDAWLLANFRNGWGMVRYLRGKPSPEAAITWGGRRFVYPPGRAGLVEVLLEIWYLKCYRPTGFYEPRPGDVVVDMGANIGAFTVDILRINPQAKVYAIEPSPETFAALRHNVDVFSNGTAVVLQLACGRAAAWATMVQGERSLDDQIQITTERSTNTPSIEVISLADLLDRIGSDRIAYLKVDIEGSEVDVFADATPATLKCIARLAIEFHDNIRPGALDLLKERLGTTHELNVISSPVAGCGMLFAKLIG